MLKANSEAVKLITATSAVESIPNNKIRITIKTNSDDINPVVRTGAILFLGEKCPAAMTRESAVASDDIFDLWLDGKSYSKAFTDKYNSVYYAGYVVLFDGTVVYDEVKHTGMYEFICAEESSTVESVANNKLRITIKAKGTLANNVTRTGTILYLGTECPEALTREVAAERSDIFDLSLEGKSYSKAFTDSKKSAYFVGYVVYNDGTVIYGKVTHTAMSDFIGVTESSSIEDVSKNKIRITIKASGTLANNVTKTGAILFLGAECPEEMSIEAAANNSEIYDLHLDGKSYSKAFTDKNDSAYYIGYVVYSDGTVIYGDLRHTSMSELKSLT